MFIKHTNGCKYYNKLFFALNLVPALAPSAKCCDFLYHVDPEINKIKVLFRSHLKLKSKTYHASICKQCCFAYLMYFE